LLMTGCADHWPNPNLDVAAAVCQAGSPSPHALPAVVDELSLEMRFYSFSIFLRHFIVVA